MRILTIVLAAMLLTACGSEESTMDPATIENRMDEAINELGDKTDLEILSSEENADGRHVITLDEDIMAFVEDDRTTMAATSSALVSKRSEVETAFLLLVGAVDDSLSFGDRHQIIEQLGLKDEGQNLMDYTKTVENNGITYTFKGTKDSLLLQAQPK